MINFTLKISFLFLSCFVHLLIVLLYYAVFIGLQNSDFFKMDAIDN